MDTVPFEVKCRKCGRWQKTLAKKNSICRWDGCGYAMPVDERKSEIRMGEERFLLE